MVDIVALAFSRACVANLGAEATCFRGEAAAPAHEDDNEPAELRAVMVEPNALRHGCHIALRQTRIRTVLARFLAGLAGLDAVRIGLVSHGDYLRALACTTRTEHRVKPATTPTAWGAPPFAPPCPQDACTNPDRRSSRSRREP